MVQASAVFTHAAVFAATSSKSSGSSVLLPILLVGFIGVYFLVLRPKRNQLRQQQAVGRNFAVGDEVVTTSGIVGKVLSDEGDRVVVETGHGHTMTVMRAAIARRVDPPVPDYSVDDLDGPPADSTGTDGTQSSEDWWPNREEDGPESAGGPS